MSNAVEHTTERLAAALGAPAVLLLVAFVGVEVWRMAAPTRAQQGHRVYGSLGEAIAMDDVRGAYAFLAAGQNPNTPIAVFDPVLTGGRELLVPPVVWAAAAGRRSIVQMLLGNGVTFERDIDVAAACLADQLKFPDIARILRQAASLAPAAPCPPPLSGPPLVALVESAR